MSRLPIDNPYLPANHQDIDNIPLDDDGAVKTYPGRAFHRDFVMTEVCSRCGERMGTRYETRRSAMEDLLADELQESICESCRLKTKPLY